MKLIREKYYKNTSLNHLPGEEWNDIPLLDGMYQLSNYGRVKRLVRWIERHNGKGFWAREMIKKSQVQIQLVAKGKRKNFRLSANIKVENRRYSFALARMVFYLFVKKFDLQDRSLVVEFKDENPFHVWPENLALISKSKACKKMYAKGNHSRDLFGNEALSVTQYDKSGRKIASYPSIMAARIAIGINSSAISDQLKNSIGYSKGYVWKYGIQEGEFETVSPEIQKKIKSEWFHKQVITQYDLAGNKIKEHRNIKVAAKSVGAQPNVIRKVILGNRASAAGFYWKLGPGEPVVSTVHLDEIKKKRNLKICRPITQYDLNGKRMQYYNSIAEAARKYKVDAMNICSALNSKKQHTACGYVWRYNEGPEKIEITEKIRRKNELKKIYNQPVTQYNQNGKRIAVYPDLFSASKKTKINKYWIAYVLSGKLLTYKNYFWKSGKGPSRIAIDHIADIETRRLAKISKPVVQYDMMGNKIKEYLSLADAARLTKISSAYIGAAAGGKFKSACGFIWKFL